MSDPNVPFNKQPSATWLRRRAWVFMPVLAILLAGCPNGAGTPVTGPASSKCTAGLAPTDVTKAAVNCGVQALYLVNSLPRANLAPIEIDLYIEGNITCGTSFVSLGCGVDDNRSYVSQGSPDPHADPSRNRIHLILDFAAGTATFQISPSCRIHPANVGPVPLGWHGQKECFAPKQLGEGSMLSVTPNTNNPKAWTVDISSVVVQTNYPAVFGRIEPGQVHNDWTITIDPQTGKYTLVGTGTNFPDFALISSGQVQCSDLATHLTGMLLGATRSYNCSGTTPPINQATPTPATPSPSASITPGHATPEEAVDGFLQARFQGNETLACSYASLASRANCNSQNSQEPAITGNIAFNGADVSGNFALVELTGHLCYPGRACESNTNPLLNMPASPASFQQVYLALVQSTTYTFSPYPCIRVGGMWYINLGP